jgi:hypothetical protein
MEECKDKFFLLNPLKFMTYGNIKIKETIGFQFISVGFIDYLSRVGNSYR